MKSARWWALSGSIGLIASFALAAPSSAAAKPAPRHDSLGAAALAAARERAHPEGIVPGNTRVSFDLLLKLRNAAGAQAFAREVSTPGSATFHHYLTADRWESRFGPSRAALTRAKSWLRREGFTVGLVPSDRLFVAAQGSARQVERVFGVQLGYYLVNGERVRLAKGTLTIPSSIAGVVSGAVGINQYLATTGLVRQGATRAVRPDQQPGPPAGFRNPQPCSKYWGQKTDTADSPSLYAPYTAPLPYDICGYQPSQLRGAYGLTRAVNSGNNGTGVTVAIVDAYDSPTLLADTQRYFQLNDPSHPLSSSQFFNVPAATFDDANLCGSGWFDEAALDVESSHSMAPGANIAFFGAQDCQDTSLLAALTSAITSGASVVSNSWGDLLGDLFTDAATKTAFDDTFMLADSTGVSVLFSSGDTGDNFADTGLTAPNYPASSPFITSVGGTTLEVNSHGARAAEYGWSTAKQVLCASSTTNCGSATQPTGTLGFQAGGGGGTSYTYTQPAYQAPVVPSALALRNEALFGPVPLRVVPDISMDADAQSGMLIGLTQAFPHGTFYAQFKEGGTSLASPLLAGVIADADQAAGSPLGFLNPILYKAYTATPSAFNDIQPPASPDSAAVSRVDYANGVSAANGYIVSLRVINYAGPETYCDGTGNCATRDVTLTTAPGFDGMTGLGSVGGTFIHTLSKF